MAEENRLPRFAVLIDADNTSPRIAAGLFEEVAKFGEASVRRIYGDFSSPRLKSWADILQKHAIDPVPAFRLHHGQERVRHRAGDRRHGPAAQRPVRRLLPGLLGQRFHAAGLPPPRAGRRRLRLRRAEDAGELPPGVPEVHLHREPAARGPGRRRPRKAAAPQAAPAAECRCSHPEKAIAQIETEDGWVGLGAVGQRLANIASDFDPRTYGYRKLSDLVRKTGAFDLDQPEGRAMRIKVRSAQPPRVRGGETATRKRPPSA